MCRTTGVSFIRPVVLRDAMRSLAIIGRNALPAIERVQERFSDQDAKIRMAALLTATSIDSTHPGTIELIDKAYTNRSKVVRDAAAKCKQKVKAS